MGAWIGTKEGEEDKHWYGVLVTASWASLLNVMQRNIMQCNALLCASLLQAVPPSSGLSILLHFSRQCRPVTVLVPASRYKSYPFQGAQARRSTLPNAQANLLYNSITEPSI
jgi:hypothetical protein